MHTATGMNYERRGQTHGFNKLGQCLCGIGSFGVRLVCAAVEVNKERAQRLRIVSLAAVGIERSQREVCIHTTRVELVGSVLKVSQ
jgi:hypothetical protein